MTSGALDEIRPTGKRLIYDILKELGVDVTDWANYGGGKKSPAANPRYCYNWAFEKPERFIVLCLWHNELEDVDGRIVQYKNYRSRSATSIPVRVRRAEQTDDLLHKAYIYGLPIRVILLRGRDDIPKNGVHSRTLDHARWAVTSYDFETGAHGLERGISPERSEGGDELEYYSAHEGETWKRLALITQRRREWKLRAAKIKHALTENYGRLLCEVPGCRFDFFERYGEIGRNYAHVHHKEPLSKAPKSGKEVKLTDLAIVCANCHAMIHIGGECREIASLIAVR